MKVTGFNHLSIGTQTLAEDRPPLKTARRAS